jgi:regulatory protein
MDKEDKKKNFEKAYGYAVYLLGLKLRTEGELREKMRLKKYTPEAIEKVFGELLANRYIDDQRYAEVYLENLKKYKHFGFFGVKKKLMEKRLPADIIESVLNGGLNEEEELKIALRFIKNYQIGIMKHEEKQKLAQKLRARGFRTSVAIRAITV